MRIPLAAGIAVAFALIASPASADEGMWTFDNFPSAKVQAAYGFSPDQPWLDRVRLGSARLAGGCSASIVSAEGLVQTNHHCVLSCVQDLSKPGRDTVREGVLPRSRAEEEVCPGVAVEVLQSIEDMTARIGAATAGKSDAAFTSAYDGEVAAIERACKDGKADRRCQVVKLYQGGQYKLYQYKRYDDVRLAFAPELDAAFFGGDPDNFNFPRYAFDVAFLRVYENGSPAATPNRLQWRSTPLNDGELVFVSGNPGTTSRALTTAQLAFQRDHLMPMRIATLQELRGRLIARGQHDPEFARQASSTFFGIENTLKAMTGRRNALVDPAVIAAKQADEAGLVRRNRAVASAYADIAKATAAYQRFWIAHHFLEVRPGQGSQLMVWARTLVRGAEERAKPDAQRLPEFTDARLAAIERALMANAPAEAALQQELLSFWGSKLREWLSADDPLVKKVLGRESPEGLAQRLVANTKLTDPAERKRLWEGGAAAIAASNDPMIVLARSFDADARALRQRFNSEVDGPGTKAQERLAKARFAAFGDSIYPDATFTLRLSYGKVAGWTEPNGRVVPSFTRFGGLYERATGADPFKLVPRWDAGRAKLDANTIFNISSTNDIIGGNSGSPLLDKEGRVVGAVFDGNIHSLGGEYFYDPVLNRTVTVASTAIEEALVDLYGMQALVDELKR
jgi:hypothetical protein